MVPLSKSERSNKNNKIRVFFGSCSHNTRILRTQIRSRPRYTPSPPPIYCPTLASPNQIIKATKHTQWCIFLRQGVHEQFLAPNSMGPASLRNVLHEIFPLPATDIYTTEYVSIISNCHIIREKYLAKKPRA